MNWFLMDLKTSHFMSDAFFICGMQKSPSKFDFFKYVLQCSHIDFIQVLLSQNSVKGWDLTVLEVLWVNMQNKQHR